MKKRLSVCVLFAMLSIVIATGNNENSKVYICTGPTATVYHKTDKCAGLYNCSDKVVEVTIAQAAEKNRRPCKRCYR